MHHDSLAYWKQQLAQAPALLALPADRPRPTRSSGHEAGVTFSLSRDLLQQAKELSNKEDVSFFMPFLTAFIILLARYSGQNNLMVGVSVPAQVYLKQEDIIEGSLNPIPLRIEFSKTSSFREVLQQIYQLILEAVAHQEVPFTQLIEDLQLPQNLSYHPLYQVTFAFRQPDQSVSEKIWLQRQIKEIQMDLMLELQVSEKKAVGCLKYATDLFAEERIQRLAGHLEVLLQAALRKPEQLITDLPLLTEQEAQQLLVEWNQTTRLRTAYPTELVRMIEAQVESQPETVAIEEEKQLLTYHDLNQQANQLAQYLRSLGVGPEVLVGICLDRSLELIICMLAVLKAGGAYVPLDPTYPQERLNFMIQDAAPTALLTKERLLPQLSLSKRPIICIDRDKNMWIDQPQTAPSVQIQPDNLAYVIYTSGSTGKPKGVQISHASLLNLVLWHQRSFAITALDRATQLTSPAFDATGWEIWPYLTYGATVVLLADEETRISIHLLRDWLIKKNITITFLPTLLAENALKLEWPPQTSLRLLLTGADTLHHYPSASLPFTLINNYGPTEATVVATSGPVLPAQSSIRPPSIGRPIDNTSIYILDEARQPVPIGVPGEIYIGGSGIARGYLNQPELTDERFIYDPFSDKSGARLYKTGDLARYLPDGNIEFLGRGDQQVKLHGFRIELGEIEATIKNYALVQDAVVLLKNDKNETKYLVAYITTQEGIALTINDLKDYLRSTLPNHMVPSIFVKLATLPLLPNGKLDRNALPDPNTQRSEAEASIVAPRNAIEEALVIICCDLLKVEQISIYANFFHLGGHSLLATQFLTRLNEIFQINLSLHTFFEAPTIANIGESLAEISKTTRQDIIGRAQALVEWYQLSVETIES